MSKSKLQIPPEFDNAPKDERIAFIQELWDKIAQDPENVPLPEHHKKILEERLAAHRANPRAGQPWSEVRDHILGQLRTR